MAAKRGSDWIPNKDGEFFGKQRSYVDLVDANKAAWGIPAADVQTLKDLRAEYEPLYHKVKNKRARTSRDVTAHRDFRKRYEKAWRAFHKEWVLNNRRIPKSELSILVGREGDTEPSPRPKINGIPFVGLTPMGGGWIKVTCKRETDENRPSMHNDADVIECRYTLVPIEPGVRPDVNRDTPYPKASGRKPWPKRNDCKEVVTSTKARFIIECGDENVGQRFYGFFRWVNLSNPSNNGVWSNALNVVIA